MNFFDKQKYFKNSKNRKEKKTLRNYTTNKENKKLTLKSYR